MEEIILKLEEELRLAMLSNDVAKLDELIDDSLVFVTPDGSVINKKFDLDGQRNGIQKTDKLSPSEQRINVVGDNCVVVTVKMDIIGTYAKIDISGDYRYLRIWRKISGKWKITAGSVVKII